MPDLPNVKIDHDRRSEPPEDVVRHGPRRWASIDPEMNQPPVRSLQTHKRRLDNRYNVGPSEEEQDEVARELMEEAKFHAPYMLGIMTSGPYVSPLMDTPGQVMWNGIKQGVGNVARPAGQAYDAINAPIDIEALARMAGYIK